MLGIGRNDPCPCGSGKKYKKCCMGAERAPTVGPPAGTYMSGDWDFICANIATPQEFRQSEDFAWFVYAGLSRDDEIALGRVVVAFNEKLEGLAGNERIKALHELYEEKYAELRERDTADGKPEFTCHAGCANCCKQAIQATTEEVDYIFAHIAENQIDVDFDARRLEKQVKAAAKVEAKGDQAEWRKALSADEQDCVFLDQEMGLCKIYEARPLNCRNYFSVGSNKYCALTPAEIPPAERKFKQQVNYLELAQIATAYLNVSGPANAYRNLSVAVAHRLRKK
ncbi:MAG: YkgJ family cysteine cluster protein [Alphaproteobacteria bacterium]|nr:YkgJ family cysteine cluster protein [Alphaproteobacteria bacterium]